MKLLRIKQKQKNFKSAHYPPFDCIIYHKNVALRLLKMAERGSEPSKRFPFTRFPSVRLQPLGHLSFIVLSIHVKLNF